MSSQKRKGTRWETTVRRYLQDAGIYAFRPAQAGRDDIGDVHAPPFVIQAKDWKDVISALREGVEGVRVQRLNAGMPFGVAVVKRARKPVADAYVIFRLGDFPALIRAVIDGERAADGSEAHSPSDTDD